LTPLQVWIIRRLAQALPEGVLSGGAALAAFYTRHRFTRDVDLFFEGRGTLDDVPARAVAALRQEGVHVEAVQTSPTFHRLRVASSDERVLVDLVADPTPKLQAAAVLDLAGASVRVDTRHEIFVNKLCTLLGRAEVRDLIDVRALLEAGEQLEPALADAPRKDGGFSPLTLAWVLRGVPVQEIAGAAGESEAEGEALSKFRDDLVDALVLAGTP
jgi:predicted nucleotidyltransferase component of viral defense system